MWLLFHMLALQSQELFRGHPFVASTQKVGGCLEISQILLSLNNRYSACFCGWGVGYSFVFMGVKYIATFVVMLLKSFSK